MFMKVLHTGKGYNPEYWMLLNALVYETGNLWKGSLLCAERPAVTSVKQINSTANDTDTNKSYNGPDLNDTQLKDAA